jgi:hypothetical protein
MKAKKGFKVTDVCGSHIIIAEGEENIDFSNIISMNDSALLLWNSIQGKDFTVEDLADILTDNYQLDDNTPLPKEQALKDAQEVANQWKEAEIIEE